MLLALGLFLLSSAVPPLLPLHLNPSSRCIKVQPGTNIDAILVPTPKRLLEE
jgi:hypothetical protein